MQVYQYQIVLGKDRRSYVRKSKSIEVQEDLCMSSPELVYEFMEDVYEMSTRAEEYMYMVACNNKMAPIGIFCISHGTVGMTVSSPREVYLRALLVGATNIVLVHNHPSQMTQPSHADFIATKRIKEAGGIVGVKLVDHIIIGSSYYSFKRNGDLA